MAKTSSVVETEDMHMPGLVQHASADNAGDNQGCYRRNSARRLTPIPTARRIR